MWHNTCRMREMTHSHERYDSFICETWLIHMSDMTHVYMWHLVFMCVTWLIRMRDISDVCVTWLIHMCDMTHSYVWLDSFIWVTWLIHMSDMTHSYVWHDSCIWVNTRDLHVSSSAAPRWWVKETYINEKRHICVRRVSPAEIPTWQCACVCVTWCICVCDMTCVNVWHDSFTLVTWLMQVCSPRRNANDLFLKYKETFMCPTRILKCVTWLIHMWDMILSHMWHDLFICVTWLIHILDLTQGRS